MITGVLSVAILLCLAVGWFNIVSPEITLFLNRRLFYVLVGITFAIQAQFFTNKTMAYPMYAAAGLCILGAFLPFDSNFAVIKTIGLIAGVILSMFNRQRAS